MAQGENDQEFLLRVIEEKSGWDGTPELRRQLLRDWLRGDEWDDNRARKLTGKMLLTSPASASAEVVSGLRGVELAPDMNALAAILRHFIQEQDFKTFDDRDRLEKIANRLQAAPVNSPQSDKPDHPTPKSPLAIYSLVPPLPGSVVDRPNAYNELKAMILAKTPDARTLAVTALQGLGGVGKSTIVNIVARDADVWEAFPDKILWATLGTQPEILSLQSAWIRALGDHDFRATTETNAKLHLTGLLQDRSALIIIDDAWNLEAVDAFLVGGPACKTIITTRDRNVAPRGTSIVPLDVMSTDEAISLFETRSTRTIEASERESVMELMRTLGYLPLAVELAAGLTDDLTIEEILDDIIGTLESDGASGIRDEKLLKKHSLRASLSLSLRRLSEQDRSRFAWFGVLRDDDIVTQGWASTIWRCNEREARAVLARFRDKALLQSASQMVSDKTYRLHDLVHDMAVRMLTNPLLPSDSLELPGLSLSLMDAHRHLLMAYSAKRQNELWHTLPDDGYIYERLIYHMDEAGDLNVMLQLLREESDFGKNGWFERRESLGQAAGYIEDVLRVRKAVQQNIDRELKNGKLASSFVEEIRILFIISSLNSLAGNLPTELLTALVTNKIWALYQAQSYAIQGKNIEALIEIAKLSEISVQPDILFRALSIARKIDKPSNRVRALISIVAALVAEEKAAVMQETLTAAREIDDAKERSSTLTSIAAALPHDESKAVMQEALASAREINNAEARANALTSIAAAVPPDESEAVIQEALTAAREIDDAKERSSTLTSIASALPHDESRAVMQEALAAARKIDNELDRARTLIPIAAALATIGEIYQALAIAREFNDERMLSRHLSLMNSILSGTGENDHEENRATVFSSIISGLITTRESHQALAIAREIDNELDRARTLISIAAALTPDESVAVMHEALAAAREIDNELDRARTLISIAVELAPEESAAVMQEALAAARKIDNELDRARTLNSIALVLLPAESVTVLQEALAIAREINDAKDRARTLISIATALAAIGKSHQALAIAREIDNELDRARTLISIAEALTPDESVAVMQEALTSAREIDDAEARASTLISIAEALAPEENEAVMQEALSVAREIDDAKERSRTLIPMASVLTPEESVAVMQEALATAREIDDAKDRARTLISIAEALAKKGKSHQALAIAREINDAQKRASTLISIAAALTPDESVAVMHEALAAAREIDDAKDRARTLSSIASASAPEESEAVMQEALTSAREINHAEVRANELTSIAATLTPAESVTVMQEALGIIREIDNGWDRSRTFILAASALATTGKSHQALAIAREIDNELDRARTLISIAEALTPDESVAVMQEALTSAREIDDAEARASTLISIAEALAPEENEAVMQEALSVAREIDDAKERSRTLTSMASVLAEKGKSHQALAIAREIDDAKDRARTLISIAEALAPEEKAAVMQEALTSAREIDDAEARASTLISIAEALAPEENVAVMQEALATAREIDHAELRSRTLTSIAKALAPEEKAAVMQEALAAAREIDNAHSYAITLAVLLKYFLTQEALHNLTAAHRTCNAMDFLSYQYSDKHKSLRLFEVSILFFRILLGQDIIDDADSVSLEMAICRRRAYNHTHQLFQALGDSKRADLLRNMGGLIGLTRLMAGNNAVKELASIVSDVGRWWP